jgi:alkanesulfonate monooxygenase SsuD/methylene tetrahydromethanopterin reductase-like flavin-dependent oxidoreductase (luciferase family)
MAQRKKIGFLSFGAWHPGGGMTRTAGDALSQTVELAVAAEEVGIDGAFVRVHHFSRQLSSPFPLLAAIGVKTSRIEIGTGVIDMRYENPLYMAEEAAAADLLARGRLQLGVSRGSPEPTWHGAEVFGYAIDHDQARDKTALFRAAISRVGRSYTGEPDQIADALANDAAVRAADTLLLTVASQLGVDYNATMLETIARDIAPAVGWEPQSAAERIA